MSPARQRLVLNSMLIYYIQNDAGRTVVPTSLTETEIKALGAVEADGKWNYQIHHEGRWHTFQLLARAGK